MIQMEEVCATKIITVPHSHKRILELANATTHGGKFMATGGSHVMAEDVFKSAEIHNRERQSSEMEKDKATRLSKGQVEHTAKAIIVEKESEFQISVFSQLSITQLDTLLNMSVGMRILLMGLVAVEV